MEKIDYKKEYKALYTASRRQVALVDVPEMNYLMVDGQGDPNTSQAYQDSIAALYALSYTLKFMIKKSDAPVDYAVLPLEGLWWAHDMADFTTGDKTLWQWTAMVMQPAPVTQAHVDAARVSVAKKKDLAALSATRFNAYHEGLCAQILYGGPYAEEGPTIARLHSQIFEMGYALTGKHHEIYLSDPRRAAPEKLKTIIRQPIRKKG